MALRKEVLGLLRGRPELKPLDSDMRHLFTSWFNRGFLELRRIDWQTPAAVLEKLIDYEGGCMRSRAGTICAAAWRPDRRCFGFFHPALPGEPLIFVEVALTEGLATAVQPLLVHGKGGEDAARAAAGTADTAIFYSISNCQEGLRGISFGNFLIKQVVEELKAELPRLVRFATLSPVPGLRRVLQRQWESSAAELAPLPPAERAALEAALAGREGADPTELGAGELLAAATQDGWWQDHARVAALRPVLLRLCAEYLTRPNVAGARIDPVARFHLGNGARLERINWLGNISPRGMDESFGMMVNYLYDRDSIEANPRSRSCIAARWCAPRPWTR